MNASTKRTIRTLVEVVLAVCTAIPSIINGVPDLAVGGQIVAVAALVTKYFHLAEAIPGFPDWLKAPEPAYRPPA